MAYEGKFADAGKITGVANGVTFTYPGHHVLVRDLLGHPIYRDFFLKLSTTIDPSSINPATSGTGRLYYDVGNRIDNSINLQPSQGVGTYDVNGNLVHANNHPGYSNFQTGYLDANGTRVPGLADDVVTAFTNAGGRLPNPQIGDKGLFPEAAMKAHVARIKNGKRSNH